MRCVRRIQFHVTTDNAYNKCTFIAEMADTSGFGLPFWMVDMFRHWRLKAGGTQNGTGLDDFQYPSNRAEENGSGSCRTCHNDADGCM